MADNELPVEVQRLIGAFVASMDHVEVLRAMRARAGADLSVDEIAAAVRLDRAILMRVLRDLEAAGAIREGQGAYRYDAVLREDAAIGELIEMYDTRPVTLVRAIYARPTPLKSFADAFRLRKDD
jgi:hypothetical protein